MSKPIDNRHTLVLATRNSGKFREISGYVESRHPTLRLKSLRDFPSCPEVEEDRPTFLENARKKAETIAGCLHLPVLADDSGLEVDALSGEPGVLSARYAGPNATDPENNEKLLEKLKGVPPGKRTARFRCAMALCLPSGETRTAVGEVEGVILESPRGSDGFGYDPLFFLPGLNRTAAELPLEEKNRVSHRGRALTRISPLLDELLGAG